ncbi:PREDICTED: leucine zipper protein 2 isoform X2 [Rhinopithecus bieti]|uniref:leucine zipper protein 2 isoform X2 n=1 Tax=Rhinopithecus bieti TaxID=61621 RepID=UPI00083BAE3E|nr:PREDICTED: leucine zipper protein 2 isoform X2 [Rhinopithecus bieti]
MIRPWPVLTRLARAQRGDRSARGDREAPPPSPRAASSASDSAPSGLRSGDAEQSRAGLASPVTSLLKILLAPSACLAQASSVCPSPPFRCRRALITGWGQSRAPRSDRIPRRRESEGSEGRRTPAGSSMKFSPAHYLLPLLPALVLSTRQDYEELEKQLKEVFKERSTILRQLTKTSRELDGIKVNLQSLKNDEQSAKTDVKKLLELGQQQREEMKSLQEALQNQLKETSEKAEKHQATINFLKTEVERKSKMIRDLQNEAQQLTDLEQKLAVAKNELEKAALDRESQMKAMKETVQLCLTSVFRDQPPPPLSLITLNPTQMLLPPRNIASKLPDAGAKSKPQQSASGNNESSQVESTKEGNPSTTACDSQDEGRTCSTTHKESPPSNATAETKPIPQKLQMPPCSECEVKKAPEKPLTSFEGMAAREEKIL